MTKFLQNLLEEIEPLDDLEKRHKSQVLSWADSGEPLYREQNPKRHLTAGCVVADLAAEKILLVDHKLAKMWIPPGGHCEIGEEPGQTAIRELKEELSISALPLNNKPFFLNIYTIAHDHVDIVFWFLFDLKEGCSFDIDEKEFSQANWFSYAELEIEYLKRLVQKVRQAR